MIVKSRRARLVVLPTLTAIAVVAVATAIFGSGFGTAAHGTGCTPPRGPHDDRVHSSGLRVVNISCSVGRTVALACIRFTGGLEGVCPAAGSNWRCTSTKPRGGPETVQRCISGRRSMRIQWDD